MAAPAYATNLVDIDTAEALTNWSAWGGGASGLSASPDLAVQGTNAVDKQITAAEKGQYASITAFTPGAAEHIYIWVVNTTPGLLNTLANRGLSAFIGTSGTAHQQFHLTGSDVYEIPNEMAKCWPIRYKTDASGGSGRSQWTRTGTPGASPSVFGATMFTTAAVKGSNLGVDVIRRGNQVTATLGDSGTPITLASLATYADNVARKWGIVRPTPTGIEIQGEVRFGNTSGLALAYSRDSNKVITFLAAPHALSTLNALVFEYATSDIEWDNVGLSALGTNARGRIAISQNAKVWWTNSVFSGIDTTTGGGTNTKFDGCTWRGCNGITATGGSYLGIEVLVPTVAADEFGLYWNVATNPDGKIDGSAFSKGTNDHHAITFGATVPTNITLRNIDFTGFSGTANAATLNFLRASGTTTVNLVGCTGTITAKVTGTHTVTFVVDPVTTTITVVDLDTGSPIQNAVVYLGAAAGGIYPSNVTVTATASGTTATVTHTAHGMATGDEILIKGAVENAYNGVFAITVTDVNTYTYTMGSSPTSPATGTLKATWTMFNGDATNASGIVSDTRSFSGAQPVTGRVRKSTAAPFYKTGPITGTVNASTGLSLTIQMVSDE